jgi:hypothetical protein
MDQWIEASGGPWKMERKLTLADVAIMPVIVRMEYFDFIRCGLPGKVSREGWTASATSQHSARRTVSARR